MTHSDEAIAAYPIHPDYAPDLKLTIEAYRDAFDAGRQSRLVANRQALAQALFEQTMRNHATKPTLAEMDEYTQGHWGDAADELFASGIITEASKPVVDVESLARFLFDRALKPYRHSESSISWTTVEQSTRDAWLNDARALTAPDGPLRDEREVKAEAWDKGVHAALEARDEEYPDLVNPYREGIS